MGKKIFLILFIICVFFLGSCGQKPKPYDPLFPQTLPYLHLIELKDDKEAIKEIDKLHMEKIPLKKAWVAHYRGSFSQGSWNEATIWLCEAYNIKEAENQAEAMLQKIRQNPKSPFYHFKIKQWQGQKIHTFSGMGKKHTIFQGGLKVFWISTTPEILDGVLKYYLNNLFPNSAK